MKYYKTVGRYNCKLSLRFMLSRVKLGSLKYYLILKVRRK